MKRVLAVLAAAPIALATLTGCGPLEGEVVGLNYEPSSTTWSTAPTYSQRCSYRTVSIYRTDSKGRSRYVGTRQQRNCTQYVSGSHLVPHFYPACSRVSVRTDKGAIRSKCVGDATFYSLKVGDHYKSNV